MPCWPFNFVNDGRVINDKDKRTLLSVEGAPSLFIKKVERFKTITSAAFRNGTSRIATAVSFLHRKHHWEGVALKPNLARLYNDNHDELSSKAFTKVIGDSEDDDKERGIFESAVEGNVFDFK